MKKHPRPDQKEAIKAALNHFCDHDRGQMVICCGGGKTLTSLWIAQEMRAKNIVIFLPRLVLQAQSLSTWLYEMPIKSQVLPLVIGSDMSLEDVHGVTSTTEVGEVAAYLAQEGQKTVFCTYHSAEILGKACQHTSVKFDFGIYDEADFTAGQEGKRFAFSLFDHSGIVISKRLFQTATPRLLEGKEVISMDNTDVYGEVFYRLSTQEAIRLGIVCDYKILVIHLKKSIVQSTPEVCAIGLKKAISQYGLKKIITYHATNKSSGDFAELLGEYQIGTLDYRMNAAERHPVIEAYNNSEDTAILSNCDILTYGFDSPQTDCVALIDPRSTARDIVQITGRVLRKHPAKKIGYIFLPVIINDDGFLDESHFASVRRTLSTLAASDNRVADFFRFKGYKKTKKEDDLIEISADYEVEADLLKKVQDEISVRVWRDVSTLYWRPYEQAKKWVQDNLVPFGVTDYKAKWKQYCRGEFPELPPKPVDIPNSLPVVYKREYEGSNIFFAKKDNATIEEIRHFFDANLKGKLKNLSDFIAYANKTEFKELPPLPDNMFISPMTYQRRYSVTINQLLGNERQYLSYDEVKKWADENLNGEIDTSPKWFKWARGKGYHHLPQRPDFIPVYISTMNGFIDYPTFFQKQFWPYDKAQKWVHENLKGAIKNKDEWRRYVKGEIPELPSLPKGIRKDWDKAQGFKGYNDFLGVGGYNERKSKIWPYEKAQKWVHENLKGAIKSRDEWRRYVKGEIPGLPGLPKEIRKSLENYGKDFQGIKDFLGIK